MTQRGETYFSFAVPDELSTFRAAKIVAVAAHTTPFAFDLLLSVSAANERVDAFTDERSALTVELIAEELLEIDVSELFPALAAGTDLVSLRIRPAQRGRDDDEIDDDDDDDGRGRAGPRGRRRGGAATALNVIGLRFQYASDSADADDDPTNELQTLSRDGSIVSLSVSGGAVSIEDGDADPSNELQELTRAGDLVALSMGGGVVDVADADADPDNELNLALQLNGTVLSLEDAGGALQADLAGLIPATFTGDDIVDGTVRVADLAATAVETLTAESDPVFGGSPAAGITGADVAGWDAAAGWGDHGSAGYLTGEADPTVLASVKDGVSWSELFDIPADIADGDDDSAAAYSGVAPIDIDHAARTIGLNPATNAGDVLSWDGSNWVAQAPPAGSLDITLDNMQPFLAINYIVAVQGIFPSRNGSEPYLGEIAMFGGNFAPRGWALAEGQLLAISQYEALFSLFGTTYGGDGRTTFALPDLRGRVPLHAGQGPGLLDRRLGESGGVESNQITH